MEISEQQLMQMFKETFERLKAAGVYEDFYIPEDGDIFSQCWVKPAPNYKQKAEEYFKQFEH